jgi:hypothetical protein
LLGVWILIVSRPASTLVLRRRAPLADRSAPASQEQEPGLAGIFGVVRIAQDRSADAHGTTNCSSVNPLVVHIWSSALMSRGLRYAHSSPSN